jgi:hypothetical protein
MDDLIDYAGLFPPARLELDAAIRNYAGYLGAADAWMLGRFIIPAARLSELDPFVGELFSTPERPLRLSVLTGGGGGDWREAAAASVKNMRSFTEKHRWSVSIEAVETSCPGPAADGFLETMDEILTGAWLGELELFVEVPGAGLREEDRNAAGIAAIGRFAAFNRENRTGAVRRAGFKLRCGGLAAADFPEVDRVAGIIAACRDGGVPLKCTAGLHQPLRHDDPGIGAVRHGFFNVFGAGVLAHALELPEDDVRSCLSERDASAFAFSDEAFVWTDRAAGRAHSVDAASVAAARDEFMTGFGSCSFDEPREALQALGLLA